MRHEGSGYHVDVDEENEGVPLWQELRASIVMLGAVALVATVVVVASKLTAAIGY